MLFFTIFKRLMQQSTPHILMIKPYGFGYNAQTANNNYFQHSDLDASKSEITSNALLEFDGMVEMLSRHGINVMVYDNKETLTTPDAVFPNNWISTHSNGTVVLYPMFAPNRRKERNPAVIELLTNTHHFKANKIEDFSDFEAQNKFLEGTGSMLLDRIHKIVYASLSERTSQEPLEKFCNKMKYELVTFQSYHINSGEHLLIYHTNVMMCLAKDYAVVCLEAISNDNEREVVASSLKKSGKVIVELTMNQIGEFAGNMLEVIGANNRSYLVMSSSAFESLTEKQKAELSKFSTLLHSPLHTIEKYGGGSARCMLAEVFLPNENT